MKVASSNSAFGFTGYSLKKNSNRWRVFYVQTRDNKEIEDMMTYLCTLDIDEEISSLVRKRDWNYITDEDIIKIYDKYNTK